MWYIGIDAITKNPLVSSDHVFTMGHIKLIPLNQGKETKVVGSWVGGKCMGRGDVVKGLQEDMAMALYLNHITPHMDLSPSPMSYTHMICQSFDTLISTL